ncbi:DUF4199 domain-containing protein [Hugenholtzia roseola]|uniref:DUF4199 domain-containing protein n=1 Tax=Hugenholtzia roseola TaxID=1002 RepID=UPI000478E1FB|nr:DUF4199 domain-containing protein [Hugenholtzia roseola]
MEKLLFLKAAQTGLQMAAGIFGYAFFLQILGQSPFREYEFLYLPIYAILLFVGMYGFRQKHKAGKLKGVEAISFGLTANLVTCLSYGVLLWIWLQFFPQILTDYKEMVVAYLNEAQKAAPEYYSDEFVAAAQKDLTQTTALTLALDKASKLWLIGMVIQMAVALFVKKN